MPVILDAFKLIHQLSWLVKSFDYDKTSDILREWDEYNFFPSLISLQRLDISDYLVREVACKISRKIDRNISRLGSLYYAGTLLALVLTFVFPEIRKFEKPCWNTVEIFMIYFVIMQPAEYLGKRTI